MVEKYRLIIDELLTENPDIRVVRKEAKKINYPLQQKMDINHLMEFLIQKLDQEIESKKIRGNKK